MTDESAAEAQLSAALAMNGSVLAVFQRWIALRPAPCAHAVT